MFRWFLLCCVLMLTSVAAISAILLEDLPLLEASPAPTPEDVAAARQLVQDVRTSTTLNVPLQTNEAQLNSAIRLGARFIRDFRARVTLNEEDVYGEVSLPVPWIGGQKWLNLTGRVPAFDGGLTLSEVTIGPVAPPADLALFVARKGANVIMGNGFGDKVLQAAAAMTIASDDIVFRLTLDEMGKNGLMQSAFGSLRGSEMPSAEEIENYHRLIRAAMADGRLQQSGSFLPYIRFALMAAHQNSTAETWPNAYTAAVFGLGKVCGAADFAVIVGRLAFEVSDFSTDWQTNCDQVTFNGRIDSRRHFITSAALQAASNRGFSISVGEFKELYDTISGAGGFDFTDMAANLSGVRMSNVMMTTPHAQLPERLNLVEIEHDVIVPFDSIPQLMPEAEFTARYDDIDSPAYHEMIAHIESRIDTLDFYRKP